MSLASELHKIKIRHCPSHGLVMGVYANNNTWSCTKCAIEENERLHAEVEQLQLSRQAERNHELTKDVEKLSTALRYFSQMSVDEAMEHMEYRAKQALAVFLMNSRKTRGPKSGKTMRIYKEKSGIISERECWVCIHDGYLYIADTSEELILILNTEWEHDKHFVG